MVELNNKDLSTLDDEISCLKLGDESYYILNHNGIYSVLGITSLTTIELKRLEGMTIKTYNEILTKTHLYGLKFADEVEETIGIEKKPIIILGLRKRTFYTLLRNGIRFVSEIINMSIKDLNMLEKMGPQSLNEIIEKVNSLGLKLADDVEEKKVVNNPINDVTLVPLISEQMNQAKLEKIERIQKLQQQIIALQQEQAQLMQELKEDLRKQLGEKNGRKNK